MTEAMGRLAGGDKSIAVTGGDRKDGIGAMARAVQVFKDNMIEADVMAAQQAEERAAREARAQRIESLTRDFDVGVGAIVGAVPPRPARCRRPRPR